MNLEVLEKEIERQGIVLAYVPLSKQKSVSLRAGGILVDMNIMRKIEEKEIIAHEFYGHHKRGLFYLPTASKQDIDRYEHRATRAAIRGLISRAAFNKALRQGATEIWSIAEYFNISEDFARQTVNLYSTSKN